MPSLLAALSLLWLAAAGCLQQANQTVPVSLPTPFSGALTVDVTAAVEDGEPFCEGKVRGHFSGCSWGLVDSNGASVGTVQIDLGSLSEDPVQGDRRSFTASVSLIFNDGSVCRAQALQFIAFPLDIPASFDPGAVSGEKGARFLALKGVTSGVITQGTGICAGAVGQSLDSRFVEEMIEYEDGTLGFFLSDHTVWLVHGT